MSDSEAHRILEAAWDSGIRYFDTAPHYGLGLSESRLGAFLRNKPRDDFVVSTKVGRRLEPSTLGSAPDPEGFQVSTNLVRRWDFSAHGLRRCLEQSLARLQLDWADVVLLHDPEEASSLGDALATGIPGLLGLKEAGLAQHTGVGSKSVTALTAAVTPAPLDVVMIAGRLTLLDQSVAAELLPLCRDRGAAVIAAAPFNSGLLSSHPPRRTSTFEYASVPSAIFDRATAIAEVCSRFDVELPTAALQFPARFGPVQCVVIGADEPAHVVEAVHRSARTVPPELWTALLNEGLVELTGTGAV